MLLTPKLANQIAKQYDRDINGINDLKCELLGMINRYGLEILDAVARRELILRLGERRRSRQRAAARSRAHYAAMRAAAE